MQLTSNLLTNVFRFADYNFITIASHPFMAWLNVTNPAQAHVNFTIRVRV